MNQKIDFAIMWVDGKDKKWRVEKDKYARGIDKLMNNEERYREWDNLQYWFRGVEKFAPFVNKIYFITEGHLPKWLNTKHPKLNIVKHSDYIPEKYLPTFSSIPIEINLHRIKDLEEHFVLFNDDMFLIDFAKKEDFFVNEKPVDSSIEIAISKKNSLDMFQHIFLNCISVINRNFDKKSCIQKYEKIWKAVENGEDGLLTNSCLNSFEAFLGFSIYHLPQAFLKSTFKEVWKKEEKFLDEVSTHKFRSIYDISQYLFRYWQIASGNISIRTEIPGKSFSIQDNTVNEIVDIIRNQTYKQICLNDSRSNKNFERNKKAIQEGFESILPDKSEFEN